MQRLIEGQQRSQSDRRSSLRRTTSKTAFMAATRWKGSCLMATPFGGMSLDGLLVRGAHVHGDGDELGALRAFQCRGIKLEQRDCREGLLHLKGEGLRLADG